MEGSEARTIVVPSVSAVTSRRRGVPRPRGALAAGAAGLIFAASGCSLIVDSKLYTGGDAGVDDAALVDVDERDVVDAEDAGEIEDAGGCVRTYEEIVGRDGTSCDMQSVGVADGVGAGLGRLSELGEQRVAGEAVAGCIEARYDRDIELVRVAARGVSDACSGATGVPLTTGLKIFTGDGATWLFEGLFPPTPSWTFYEFGREASSRVLVCRDDTPADASDIEIDYIGGRQCP